MSEPAPSGASRPSADVVLEIDSVTAGYGGAPVISEVSLQTRAGRITAIVGPNGAGKSTLLKALIGLIRVSSGNVRLNGTDVTGRCHRDGSCAAASPTSRRWPTCSRA